MNEQYRKLFLAIGILNALLGVIMLIASLLGYINQTLTRPLMAIVLGAVFMTIGFGGRRAK